MKLRSKPIYGDAARTWKVEAGDKVDDCGFAGSRGAH
jgi:hypothetical protein